MSRNKKRKLNYSALEDRRLLAVSASLSAGTLSIVGDASANTVNVGQFGDLLFLNGDLSESFNISEIDEIQFLGGAGDDFFSSTVDINTRAVGQDGNDELRTAGGTDQLFGGEGDDLLVSTGGNDRLVGNNGIDVLFGGDGDDAIFGLGGDDILHGEAGDDTLVAGFGDDVVYGDDGDDLVFGHFGNDEIFGGEGNDRCVPQAHCVHVTPRCQAACNADFGVETAQFFQHLVGVSGPQGDNHIGIAAAKGAEDVGHVMR